MSEILTRVVIASGISKRTGGRIVRVALRFRGILPTSEFEAGLQPTSDPRQLRSRKLLAWLSMRLLADIIHRTLVVGLLGVTVAGVGAGWAVHKDTLRRGQGSWVVNVLYRDDGMHEGWRRGPRRHQGVQRLRREKAGLCQTEDQHRSRRERRRGTGATQLQPGSSKLHFSENTRHPESKCDTSTWVTRREPAFFRSPRWVFTNNALIISLNDPPSYKYLQGLLLEAAGLGDV